MTRKRLLAVATIAALAAAVYAGSVLATLPVGLSTTQLAKATFSGGMVAGPKTMSSAAWAAAFKTTGASDIYVVDNKLAPGGNTGWHSHPGPSLVLVVSGQVVNYVGSDPKCTPHPYGAGSGFVDPGDGEVHMLRNEGTVPAETIAVQFVPKGGTRRIPEPDPGNCSF
ncbi:MAG TPA: cupin domain-containing protein [Gaiellaceae bacterium]|nr:cupin domain-containing protein [Gaiellaceae bacterium]